MAIRFEDTANGSLKPVKHHDERLRRVLAAAAGGEYTAFELVPRIWRQKLSLIDQRLAMAEALSHLHFLHNRGDLVSERRDGRVFWASRC